jgi:hypothetical protein
MSRALAKIPWDNYRKAIDQARNYSLDEFSGPEIRRDIYYIVLDGYVRADVLQELYGFDNSEFIAYLQEKGFAVPTSNHSNYPTTPLSIASTLNMDYIQALTPGLENHRERWLMAPFIDHSRVRALLESQGYKTVSISTNWSITDNSTTDLYLYPYPVMLSDFEGFVLDVTPLKYFKPLLGSFASVPEAETHREIVRYHFETLIDLPGVPGPKFVFSHIISPHPPFVFDRNGSPVDSSASFSFRDANEYAGSLEEYRQRYLEQVQFVNRQLEQTIEAILAESTVPPIIILMADHGSGMLTDFSSSENTCLRERFSPFAAYYLPGVERSEIPPDISSVNLFRIIFDEYFDARLPLLENRQYFPRDTMHFYDFEDVTGQVNDQCAVP